MFWYMQCIDDTGCAVSPGSPGWSRVIENISSLRKDKGLFPSPDWNDAKEGGIVSNRMEYLALLQALSFDLVIRDLQEQNDEEEMTLIHLVRILDEIDASLSSLSERIDDYYLAVHPVMFAKQTYTRSSLLDDLAKNSAHPLSHLAKNIQRLHDSRMQISQSIRILTEKTLPNMSSLCGPLLAARLLAKAGSKSHLAKMPASSLQVFGAGPSLFTHLTQGTSPPKHGIIYQYKGVHHAKKRVRGRVSRVLACQLAIAAKIDRFRGSRDEHFLTHATERLCRATM